MTESVVGDFAEEVGDVVGEFGIRTGRLDDVGSDLSLFSIVLFDEDVAGRRLERFADFVRAILDGSCTRRAEEFATSQRRVTDGTGFEFLRALFVGFDDIVVLEDLFVNLLVLDTAVGFELLGVLRPVDTVFDHLFAHVLPDPPRDRRLSEQMGVDLVGIQIRLLGDVLDPAAEILLRERSVFVVAPALDLVHERGVGIVGSRVDVEPVGDVSTGPGQRLRSRGVLDVCILVDVDDTDAIVELDVADSKRSDRADPKPGVIKHRNQRFVARVPCCLEELLDLVVGEQVTGVDRPLRRRADLDVFSPLLVTPAIEDAECLSVVSTRPVGEVVLAFEPREEDVDVVEPHLGQRLSRTLGGESQPVEVGDDRAGVDVVLCVFVTDERLDLLSIGIVDIGVGELLKLVLELPLVTLNVIDVSHDIQSIEPGDYEDSVNSPPGTTQKYYIVPRVESGTQKPSFDPQTPEAVGKPLSALSCCDRSLGGVSA